MTQLNACPACQSTALVDFYQVDDVPIQQNTPKASYEDAISIARGQVHLACCESCGFVTNRAFDPAQPIYTADYNNIQTHSGVFSQYVEGIAERLMVRYDLQNKHVIEIGCGDGKFLELLCQKGHNSGTGFDPSYTGPDSACEDRVRFVRDYYGTAYAQESADLFFARHLIEHIHDLDDLMRGMRDAIGTQQAGLFFETPDVRWILENHTFWDVFYEHCSLFSPGSLARLFARYGFDVTSAIPAFEGQYQWLDAVSGGPGGSLPDQLDQPEDIAKLAQQFAITAREKIDALQEQIIDLQRQGKQAAVWGAGAKGVTFLNTLKPGLDVLPYVVDINPEKQERYIPGAGQKIVPPEHLLTAHVDTIFIMNPNYEAEIKATIDRIGLMPEHVITIK